MTPAWSFATDPLTGALTILPATGLGHEIVVSDGAAGIQVSGVGGTGTGGSGIAEAPSDGTAYGRLDMAWIPVLKASGDIIDGGNF